MNIIFDRVVRLRQNSFVRATLVLVGGTAFAQALTVLALPVVTRIYAPSDFQSLAVYSAIIQLVSVIAGLRLENAIPLPQSDDDSLGLVAISVLSSVVFAAAVAIFVCLFPNTIERLTGNSLSGIHLWMIPAGIFAASSYTALQAWVVRDKQFSLIARTKISQAVASVASQVAIGAVHKGPTGLLVGYLLQSGAGCLSLSRYVMSRSRKSIASLSRSRIRKVMYEYRDFPKYDVIGTLAQAAGLQLPLIYIASLPIGPEVGFLSLSIRVMQVPVTMISAAVAQIYVASAADALREGALSNLTARTLGGLIKAAVGPMIAIAIVSPVGFLVAFGKEWGRAGTLMGWLAPLFVVHMLSGAVGTSLYVTGRQRIAFLLNVFGFLIRAGAVYIGSRLNMRIVSEVYAVSGTIVYVGYLLASLTSARVAAPALWREVKAATPLLLAWVLGAGVCRILLSYVAF